jgi:hypothetical protein
MSLKIPSSAAVGPVPALANLMTGEHTYEKLSAFLDPNEAFVVEVGHGYAYTVPSIPSTTWMMGNEAADDLGSAQIYFACDKKTTILPDLNAGRSVRPITTPFVPSPNPLLWPTEGAEVVEVPDGMDRNLIGTKINVTTAAQGKRYMVFSYHACWCPTCYAALKGPHVGSNQDKAYKWMHDFIKDHMHDTVMVTNWVDEPFKKFLCRVQPQYAVMLDLKRNDGETPANDCDQVSDVKSLFMEMFGQNEAYATQFADTAVNSPLNTCTALFPGVNTTVNTYHTEVPVLYVKNKNAISGLSEYGNPFFPTTFNTHHVVYDTLTGSIVTPKQSHFSLDPAWGTKPMTQLKFFSSQGASDKIGDWNSFAPSYTGTYTLPGYPKPPSENVTTLSVSKIAEAVSVPAKWQSN